VADTQVGLMQIDSVQQTLMKAVFPDLFVGITSKYIENILAGALYLKSTCMTSVFNTWALALRCYNSGPNGENEIKSCRPLINNVSIGVDVKNIAALPAGTGTTYYPQWVITWW
jgi:hypothetical protein